MKNDEYLLVATPDGILGKWVCYTAEATDGPIWSASHHHGKRFPTLRAVSEFWHSTVRPQQSGESNAASYARTVSEFVEHNRGR